MTGRLNAFLRAIPFARIRAAIRDGVFLAGLALADYGIWTVHRPAAIIFAGLAIAAIAMLGAQNPIEPHE